MKISLAIKTLQYLLAEHGDLEVVSVEALPDGDHAVEFEQTFQVLEIPHNDTDTDEESMRAVCAFVSMEDDMPKYIG